MTTESSPESCFCLRAVGLHIYRVCSVLMMVVLLLVNLWPPSLVLEVRDGGTPCD
jgi:hypothetical protein